mgnify:CR=1 FL=1
MDYNKIKKKEEMNHIDPFDYKIITKLKKSGSINHIQWIVIHIIGI